MQCNSHAKHAKLETRNVTYSLKGYDEIKDPLKEKNYKFMVLLSSHHKLSPLFYCGATILENEKTMDLVTCKSVNFEGKKNRYKRLESP